MAKVLIPSLNPHSITNSPWSIPVNLTFSRAEQFLLKLFAIVKYHLHTAILFTWTDYKTIFLPIVSSPIRCLFLSPHDTLPRRRPLHVLRRLYSHCPASSNAGYGFGSIYYCAMYPTRHAAVKKTKSTVLGVLSQQGE